MSGIFHDCIGMAGKQENCNLKKKSIEMKRPELNDKISVTDFKDFYRLKKELTDFFKSKGISATGSKQELTERIIISAIGKNNESRSCTTNNIEVRLEQCSYHIGHYNY